MHISLCIYSRLSEVFCMCPLMLSFILSLSGLEGSLKLFWPELHSCQQETEELVQWNDLFNPWLSEQKSLLHNVGYFYQKCSNMVRLKHSLPCWQEAVSVWNEQFIQKVWDQLIRWIIQPLRNIDCVGLRVYEFLCVNSIYKILILCIHLLHVTHSSCLFRLKHFCQTC